MVLFCHGKRLLRGHQPRSIKVDADGTTDSSTLAIANAVNDAIQAGRTQLLGATDPVATPVSGSTKKKAASVAAAAAVAGTVDVLPIEHRPVGVIEGDDPSLLVVLQREVGAVDPLALDGPQRICSIDATTCVILALRDARSGRVALAHFDAGADQATDGIQQMLRLMGIIGNGAAESTQKTLDALKGAKTGNSVDDTVAQSVLPRLDVAMVGAARFPRFSAATLADLIGVMSQSIHAVFDLLPLECAVWNFNSDPAAPNERLLVRGLEVDAVLGRCRPVMCNPKNRNYPLAHARGLRIMSHSQLLSSVSLFYGEVLQLKGKTPTSAAPKAPAPATSFTPGNTSTMEVIDDEAASKSAAAPPATADEEKPAPPPFMLVVRPFKWPAIPPTTSMRPVAHFASMSTSPSMEAPDFGTVLKGAFVYGSLTPASSVFGAQYNQARLFTVSAPVATSETSDAASSPSKIWLELTGSAPPPSAAVVETKA